MKFELFRKMLPYEKKVCLILALSGLPNIFPSMMTLVTNYEPDFMCDWEQMFPGNTIYRDGRVSEISDQGQESA